MMHPHLPPETLMLEHELAVERALRRTQWRMFPLPRQRRSIVRVNSKEAS
jgi:hypothetical protein